uniref:Cannabinoid receptor interacting protein 1a n=1 Tax=Neogobius melanostomus TaxID=47308 RepID=A0A8C6TDP8_9GOBI
MVGGDGVPPLLDISIALRLQPNDGPVFFKVDGTRFGQGRTIKLLTGSKYRVEVVMKPGFRCCPLEEQSRDRASVVYQGKYDTRGFPHKSGTGSPSQRSIREHCQTLMWVNKEAFN